VLEAPIASGGMAQVWSAADELLDRQVAIKLLHPHLTTDEAFVKRFRREAVASASLTHHSIVAVFDTVSSNGLEAIVMELIEGHTLRAMLDEITVMAEADVIHLGMQIASALDVAHSAGIVHRDIKPANIMIGPDRMVKVTDFGIAKAGTDADLTATGTLLGTAKYLSPEQVSGAPLDPRSDLYALGVVLFEALTGAVPFKANTDAATALARLHQAPPPLSQLRPDVSPALASVIGRCMAREPDERYRRARDLYDALTALASETATDLLGNGVPLPPDPNRPVPPHPSTSTDLLIPPGRPGAHSPSSAEPTSVGTGRPVPPQPPIGPFPGSRPIRPEGKEPYEPKLVDGAPPSPPPVDGQEQVRRSRRSVLVPMVIVVALGVAAVALLTGGQDGAPPSLGSDEAAGSEEEAEIPTEAVLVGLTSFDPQSTDSDKQEREDLVPLAIDGDPATAWTTETYRRPQLGGGMKDGVGLVLEFEESAPLNQLVLLTGSSGWSAQIFVGDEFPADRSSWGEPTATVEQGRVDATIELGQAEGQQLLLWLTDTGTSNTDGDYRFELLEIAVE
jgi:serine/threonine protein kinase